MPSVKSASFWSRLAGDSVATLAGFALTCAVLLGGVWATDRNTRRLADANRELDQTHRVVTGLERLLSTLTDAETGQRGFVITGDPALLQPYGESADRVWAEFDEVQRLTAGDPAQRARLAAVRPRIAAKLAELKEVIDLRRTDENAALAAVRGGRGKADMDAVRATVGEMQGDEDRRIAERGDRAAAALRQAVVGELVTGAIGVLMVGGVFALVRRNDRVRQRARAVVAEQRERLRTTLASIGDAVVSTDPAGNVTYLNAVAEALTGWTNGEAAGVPLARVFHIVNESTRREVENPAARALAEGVVVGLANHTVLIARDGTEWPIDDSAAPIRAADGGIAGCVLVFRDTTDRKKAEADARRSAELLRGVTDGTTDLIFVKDRDGRMVFANPATLRAMGLTEAELLGTTEADRPTAPGEAEAIMANDRRIMAAGATEVVDEVYTGPAGTRVYQATKSPLRSEAGAVTGIIGVLRDVTDPRRAERAVRDAEARLRMALTAARMVAWEYDVATGTVATSDNAAEVFGLPPGSALGTFDFGSGLVHPDDAARYRATMRKAVEEAGSYLCQYRLVRPVDGEVVWLEERGHAIPNGPGGAVRVVAVAMDITDRKRAEDQFHVMADNIPQLAWMARPDGHIYWYNRRWYEYTGTTLATQEGWRWESVHDPAELPRVLAGWKASIATGEPFDMVFPLKGGDGVFRPFLTRVMPVKDAEGRVTQWFGTNTDISEQRAAEAVVAASEVRYRRLFETAKDGILILDAGAATIADANPFLVDLLGYSRDELLGKELWQIGLFKDVEANKEAVRELQENRYIRYGNLPLETKTGRRINVEFVSNVYGEGGHAVIQCNVRDMTDRARLEDALWRQAAGLSEADRLKNEFLATLAHELRNPLAPIRNGLELVRLAEGGSKLGATLAMMERQLTQLVRLVDDLLDVSRITSGKLDLRPERVELRAVVAAAAEDARPLLEQAGHDLAVALPPGPVYLNGDATRLAQVVTNLLNNSAKYTPRGGHVRLALGLDGGAAVVTVSDDGVGIPAAMLGRVFDMFTQVDRALEKTTGGLGIGLSLVKGLVEMHGGAVEARSGGEGRGSEFVVRLPVAPAAVDPPPPADGGAAGAVPAGGRRVLVVDDSEDAADSLGQLLELLGHEVRTAYDGEAGVEAARAFRPDVVLMDIGMPKLNGYEAARRIRGQAWGAGMVLVAQTGWGQDDDRRKTTAAGFDYHLVKPVDPPALLKLLAALTPAPA